MNKKTSKQKEHALSFINQNSQSYKELLPQDHIQQVSSFIFTKAVQQFPVIQQSQDETKNVLQEKNLATYLNQIVSKLPPPSNKFELKDALLKMRNIADQQEKTIQINMAQVNKDFDDEELDEILDNINSYQEINEYQQEQQQLQQQHIQEQNQEKLSQSSQSNQTQLKNEFLSQNQRTNSCISSQILQNDLQQLKIKKNQSSPLAEMSQNCPYTLPQQGSHFSSNKSSSQSLTSFSTKNLKKTCSARQKQNKENIQERENNPQKKIKKEQNLPENSQKMNFYDHYSLNHSQNQNQRQSHTNINNQNNQKTQIQTQNQLLSGQNQTQNQNQNQIQNQNQRINEFNFTTLDDHQAQKLEEDNLLSHHYSPQEDLETLGNLKNKNNNSLNNNNINNNSNTLDTDFENLSNNNITYSNQFNNYFDEDFFNPNLNNNKTNFPYNVPESLPYDQDQDNLYGFWSQND
ncbi:hypothetical protein PPERSA_10388 [Pseudocohnilembus persalinus]|uniref:Uncharacterized protein n=1 Tax=Pseudocohnilembus persalinus TaxID=266149 RepID=A0A0V0R320_PSEPJ|nr:hypothetical protein PPERSA_10388 [Pseudocohnilembus persalinus]|eukprot:KRX08584.1 hypothetical protein PPERSA_10388 [Pseudocohnilembus persalinus]